VQDPDEALADEMPRSALRATEVDLVVPSARLGDVLSDLVREPAGWPMPVPPDIRLEVNIAAGERVDSEVMQRLADPAPLTCPQCGGVMSELRGGKPLRYRCQVGHAFTADALAKEQESTVDEALRTALRIIEERAELVTRMAEEARSAGRPAIADTYEERAEEYRRYAESLRRAVLESMGSPVPSTPPDPGAPA
jgi:two-component system chemotaxis response regulator CheB